MRLCMEIGRSGLGAIKKFLSTLAVVAAIVCPAFGDGEGTWEEGEPAWPADYWSNYTNRIDTLKASYVTVAASAGQGTPQSPFVFIGSFGLKASESAVLLTSPMGLAVLFF